MLALVLLSCVTEPRPGTPPPLPDVEPTADQLTCDADSDCVALELGCCNHCNGGRVLAVNKQGAKEFAAHKQAPCDDFVCTRKMCRPEKVRCAQGTCRLK